MKRQLVQFVNQCTIALLRNNYLTLAYSSSLCVLSISSYRLSNRHVLNSPCLINLIICTDSSRELLSETYFLNFFFNKCILVKNVMTPSTVWSHCLDRNVGTSRVTHYCFVLSIEMLTW